MNLGSVFSGFPEPVLLTFFYGGGSVSSAAVFLPGGEGVKKKRSKWEEEGLDGYDWYEGQPRWPLRRIIGVIAIAISIFMYAFLFYRFFTAFSGGFGDLILLAGKSANVYPSENAVVRRFYPETKEDEDGSVQVQFTAALETTDCFQTSFKINKKTHPPAGDGPGYTVALRWDLDGETRILPLVYYEMRDHFQYRYFACVFENVPDAEHATLTLLVCPAEGEASLSTAFYAATVGGESVYSVVIRPQEDRFITKED